MKTSPLLLGAAMSALTASAAAQQLPPPLVPPGNPVTEAKRVLGKALFWDEQLSSDNTVSCGTCHIPSQGGSDPRLGSGSVHPGPDGLLGTVDDERNSPGVRATETGGSLVEDLLFGLQPQVTDRHAPSTIGAAYFPELFWDGRASGTFVNPETGAVSLPFGAALETQSVEPLLSEVEMADAGRTWDDVRHKLERIRPLGLAFDLTPDLLTVPDTSYPALFEAAFGDPEITAERIGFALATYQRTLVPDQTPWDLFVSGNQQALTPGQRQGWDIFRNPGSRCDRCHQPPLFSDRTFRNLGLRPNPEDRGRQLVTGDPADRGRFKVPSLRGAAERGAFFHTGASEFEDMRDVVQFYRDGGGPSDNNKDPLLGGINIPGGAVGPLVDFLENGLTDPRMAAELPPFDRPRLNSERAQPWPTAGGGWAEGSGGFVPQAIPVSPFHLGGMGTKVAVDQALGGAQALAVVSLRATPGGTVQTAPFARVIPVNLSGSGPGQGTGTVSFQVPHDPVFSGASLSVRWLVRDAGASSGIAASQTVEGTLF